MIGSIISAIVIGAVIGLLARLILPGRQNISLGLTVIIGIVAALLGTLIAYWLGVATTRGIDWWEHIIQLVLAIIGVGAVSSRRRPSGTP
ncbi:GlsB/YeaQ/YmgE family stress response membrane protein [Acrocarpospora catenulata]|uniref:GlsB/YeaQ/YmgE family stress response membrane protein n=1 Tax=Acrocarpospora catenulata TaxID=2836182 RepID=UPI00202394A8|nr:GlsB/YeaQ/YmgE family stress response membrane protein [Acrocarpospora catenulata]